jgi:hypothetical protein
MPTGLSSVGAVPGLALDRDRKVVEPAGSVIPPSSTASPSTNPEVGSSITRAQTFPSSLHGNRLKPPRPAPGTVQVHPPMESSPDLLPKASKQVQRTVSEPTVLRSAPSSPTRPSLTSPSVSSTAHHGRHANEWLFGNFSLRKAVKGVWKGHESKDK